MAKDKESPEAQPAESKIAFVTVPREFHLLLGSDRIEVGQAVAFPAMHSKRGDGALVRDISIQRGKVLISIRSQDANYRGQVSTVEVPQVVCGVVYYGPIPEALPDDCFDDGSGVKDKSLA